MAENLNLVVLHDTNRNEDVLPITHEDAVLDADGKSVGTKFTEVNNELFDSTTITKTYVLDIASMTGVKAYIGQSNTWLSLNNNTSYRCVFIPIIRSKRFVMTANASNGSYYAFLTSSTVIANATPDFVSGETGRHEVAAGATVNVEIPDGTTFLYIATYSTISVTPQYAANLVFDKVKDIVESADLVPLKNSANLVTSGGVYGRMVQSMLVLGEEKDMIFPIEYYTTYSYLFYSGEYADYIELPFDPNGITRIEGSFSRTGSPLAYERIFGNWIADDASCIRVINSITSATQLVFNFKAKSNNSKLLDMSTSLDIHTFTLYYNTYILDGTTVNNTTITTAGNDTHILVFPGYSGGCDYKMYTLYITYNGNLHTLTPAKNPIGVYGFYDEYDGSFYASENNYITGGN